MAKHQVLTDAEQEIEEFARTVQCPNCGAAAGMACIGEQSKQKGHRAHMYASHLGRLLAARCGKP